MLAFNTLQKIINSGKPFTCTGPVFEDEDGHNVVGRFGLLHSDDGDCTYIASSVDSTITVCNVNTMKPLFVVKKNDANKSWVVQIIHDGIKSYEAIDIACKIRKMLD